VANADLTFPKMRAFWDKVQVDVLSAPSSFEFKPDESERPWRKPEGCQDIAWECPNIRPKYTERHDTEESDTMRPDI